MSAVAPEPESRPVELSIGPHRFIDALRCTLQSEHGLLYLNATTEQPVPLGGYERALPLPARVVDLLALLDAFDPAWRCTSLRMTDGLRPMSETALVSSHMRAEDGPVSDERLSFGRTCGAVDAAASPSVRVLAFPGSGGLWLEASLTPAALAPPIGSAIDTNGNLSPLLVAEAVEALIAARDLEEVAIAALSVYLRNQLAAVKNDCSEVSAIAVEGLCVRVTLDSGLSAQILRDRMFERGVLVSVAADDVIALSLPPIVRPAEVDVVSGVMRAAIYQWPVYSQAPCCEGH